MIDTHAHLNPISLNPSLTRGTYEEEIPGDFRIDGLEYVILSGANIETSKSNIGLAETNKKLLAAVGIHPQDVGENSEKDILILENLLKKNKNIVAVGECGLEFIEPYNKELQIKFFEAQIALAKQYNKPLIIHARKAIEEVFDILRGSKTRGVIHCYSAGKKRVQKLLNLGKDWYFGIDGNVTYEVGLAEVVRAIPHDRLLAETDSPELTPLPFRGQKNFPENVKYVYRKISEIWEMDFEETEKILDENARRLFQIKSL